MSPDCKVSESASEGIDYGLIDINTGVGRAMAVIAAVILLWAIFKK